MSGISFAQAAPCNQTSDCAPCGICIPPTSGPGPGWCSYNMQPCLSGCYYDGEICVPLVEGMCFGPEDCDPCMQCFGGGDGTPGECGVQHCGIPTGQTLTRVTNGDGDCRPGCTCTPQGEGSICTPIHRTSSETRNCVPMTASVDVSCEENVVNVKAKDNSLEGVEVSVLKFYSTILEGKTNSSGQYGFFAQDGTVQISLSYFEKGGNCYTPPTPLGCGNAACPEDYVCIKGICEVKLKTTEECAPKPCADCPVGNICVDNKCVAPPPPPPPPPKLGCTSNTECRDEDYCNREGNCVPVETGACGYVLNHTWKEYECCANTTFTCKTGYVCKVHNCTKIEYSVSGEDGFVSETGVVTASEDGSPYVGELVVTKPDGSWVILQTDSSGMASFLFDQTGDWKIELKKNGEIMSSVVVTALATPPTVPPGEPNFFDELAQQSWLLLILLLILGLLVYRYYFAGKGSK